MSALYVLWMRELKRYLRSPIQIVSAWGQPILYLVALGYGFGQIFKDAGMGNYLQFLAPGVIGMTLLLHSITSGMTVVMDRQIGFLKSVLVAPVSRTHIMLGRTLGNATVSFFQGVQVLAICVIAGFRPVDWALLPSALLMMALTTILFSALGLVIGSRLQNLQTFPLIMNFFIVPVFFLSGALFPLSDLPWGLQILTYLNPLSYGVDGMRTALSGDAHFGLTWDTSVLVVANVLILLLGAYSFSKVRF